MGINEASVYFVVASVRVYYSAQRLLRQPNEVTFMTDSLNAQEIFFKSNDFPRKFVAGVVTDFSGNYIIDFCEVLLVVGAHTHESRAAKRLTRL